MAYIPFFLNVEPADRIVIIGGGAVALAKTQALRSAGAALHVVAEKLLPELHWTIQRLGGTVDVSLYEARFLYGAKLVIAATSDKALNARIRADARGLGIPVNVVDTPELCDFIFPAVVERGDIQIAISTSGINPTLARLLKRRIEQLLPWNFAALAAWLKTKRTAARQQILSLQSRRLFWEDVLESAIPQEILEGNLARGEALFAEALKQQPEGKRAALYLIGAGPGHPDLITVKATQLLGQADVILYDRLVPHGLLSRYARKDAQAIAVGKEPGRHHKTQAEIDALLERQLRAGKIVVRLKGGDPGIYAHSAEEIAVAARLGVPYQIVPGITAALGCAATAGIPLTERDGASGVRFLTLYDEQLHDDAFWKSLGLSRKETLVFYMSGSRHRAVCERLLQAGFHADTLMLAIEQGTTPQHEEYEATIGTFADRYEGFSFITPALLIVGDVVRWRARHQWKEAPSERKAYFAEDAHGGI
ncbi:MAG: uroporphyrinogen-III C-methyltransferase [Alphaproteobacteria bacterium]|nr:uroporphyrinogen-III C-methyltransferase [Alphaproteobacteria bacterium]